MTDQEYLQTLDLLEGNGDNWGKTETSSQYGITDGCINRITRNMIAKDSKGNYTAHALKVQALVSPSLKNTLLDNAEWKDETLKKQASLSQVGKHKDSWKELALALREINKDAIKRRQTVPLSEYMQERLCLGAHNREGVIKSPQMEKVIAGGNEEEIRHAAMNYLDHVNPGVLPGIRRRQASIFHPKMSIKEAWEYFDKDGKENIDFLVDDAYSQDSILNEQRLKAESISQATSSRYGQADDSMIKTGGKSLPNEKKFVSDLIGDSSLAKYSISQDNGSKTPQNKSFWDSAVEVGQRVLDAIRPMFPQPFTANDNQVANNEQNVLNNNQEVQK